VKEILVLFSEICEVEVGLLKLKLANSEKSIVLC